MILPVPASFPSPDPLAGASDRFPLGSPGGRIVVSDADPSAVRPFGLRYAVQPAPIEAKRRKPPTYRSVKRIEPTHYDGQGAPKVKPDAVWDTKED